MYAKKKKYVNYLLIYYLMTPHKDTSFLSVSECQQREKENPTVQTML